MLSNKRWDETVSVSAECWPTTCCGGRSALRSATWARTPATRASSSTAGCSAERSTSRAGRSVWRTPSRGRRGRRPRFLQIRFRHESRDKYVIHISKTAFQKRLFWNAALLCEHYGAAEQVTWLMTHPYRVGAPPIGMLQSKGISFQTLTRAWPGSQPNAIDRGGGGGV